MMNVPSSKDVINDLAPILPVIYEGIEHGIFEAKEFFKHQKEKNDLPHDSCLASHITRYSAYNYLKENVSKVVGKKGYVVKKLSNSGLELTYNEYNIKIYKSKDDKVPPPGNSITKQQYYNQKHHQMELFSENDTITNPNLILLWDVSPTYKIKSLSIAYPKSVGPTTNSTVPVYWNQTIPEEILNGTQHLTNVDFVEREQDLEVEDLPISLNTEKKIEKDKKK